MALPEKLEAIRQKLARGETLDPAEELEWTYMHEFGGQPETERQEAPERAVREIGEDDEDVEHHDVGLRRNALNIIMIERGDMFGGAVQIHQDMNQTLKELQQIVVEIYQAKRQQNKNP